MRTGRRKSPDAVKKDRNYKEKSDLCKITKNRGKRMCRLLFLLLFVIQCDRIPVHNYGFLPTADVDGSGSGEQIACEKAHLIISEEGIYNVQSRSEQ